MSRRIRVTSSSPEAVLWAAAGEPWRRGESSPNRLFYLDPPIPAERPAGRRDDVGAAAAVSGLCDWPLVRRLKLDRRCPRCGSGSISWTVLRDGRAVGHCHAGGCGASGTPDVLLKRGRRVSRILFAVNSACRHVQYGLAPRRRLWLTAEQRRMAAADPTLAAAIDDLEVIASARLHVLEQHPNPALDPELIPLSLDFLRYRAGRPAISRHEARSRLRALTAADIHVQQHGADKGPHAHGVPVYRLARPIRARTQASRRRQARRLMLPKGRTLLCVLPKVRAAAPAPDETASVRHDPARDARAGPPGSSNARHLAIAGVSV